MGAAARAWGWNPSAAAIAEATSNRFNLMPPGLLESKCIKVFAPGYENILMPVEHVGDRGIAGTGFETGMPKRFAGTRVECNEVAGAVAAEQQVPGCGKQALGAGVGGVLPGDLAGLYVDGAKLGFYDTAS